MPTRGEAGGGTASFAADRHAVVAALLVAVPIGVDAATSGPRTVIRYFAPDAFVYHTVARNLARGAGATYDGVHAMNGFQPLWQAVLGALYALAEATGAGELAYLWMVLGLSTLLAAGAVALLGQAIRCSLGSLPASYALVPVGAYALCLAPYWILAVDVRGLLLASQGPFPLFGTLWSYVNGMESPLVLACYAALARAWVAPARSPVVLGLLCAALCLARLDHGAFGLAFGMALVHETPAARRRGLAGFAIAFLVPLLAYLAWSRLTCGTWWPVSGTTKSTFPFPTADSFHNLATVFRAPVGDDFAISRLYRATQLLLPGLAAAWVLGRGFRTPGALASLLRASAAGVLILALYDLLFVPTFAMGHWYFPVSVLFVSLCLLARGATRFEPRLATCVVLVLVTFAFLHRRVNYHDAYANLYFVEGPRVRSFYGAQRPQLLEDDDGIVAFATDLPTMSTRGFALDPEGVRASRQGRLLALARERGFDRVATLAYLGRDGARPGPDGTPPAETFSARWSGCSTPEYVSAADDFRILRCR